ncbi:AAA family ATPase [Actinomadura rudentiformis]|uniref:DUF2637 domain-containing protein n=1 Tax=Actinomadura rudentiformis TaxID=359158 RepID=A0A6H9YBZ0_9ACTN|nr:hypothetical protein [Actinomadura rudentiformis]KAB2341521.1 hypothetical protein F8566_40975 [Actinomadura rudentiformis]
MKPRVNERQPSPDLSPDELAGELKRRRELQDAQRSDELARLRAEAGHKRARADVAEESRLAELARVEREADVRAEAELARMYRDFRAAGERTRIRSLMARSGEARALSLDRLRSRNLAILVPFLIGFGIWSTTGVQQGAARLMSVTSGSPVWWVLWGLEALLIGTVCWIIIVRARLATSGGQLSDSAEKIGIGCLTTSIFLNLIAAVPVGAGPHVSGWALPGAMFAHAIGPIGAAVVAHLIGVIDRSITDADPWHDKDGQEVPRLAAMDLRPPASATETSTPESASKSTPDSDTESADKPTAAMWPIPREGRPTLPIIARPAAAQDPETGLRTGDDRRGEREAKAPREPRPKVRRPRPNKGVPVPESAKPTPRPLTDADHVERLVSAIDKGEVPESASIRQVQGALGLGFDRARRIQNLYRARLAEMDRQISESLPKSAAPTRPDLSVVGGAPR